MTPTGENLNLLEPVTRARPRDPNWDIRPASPLFQRSWFRTERPSDVPEGVAKVRYWDLAATPRTPGTTLTTPSVRSSPTTATAPSTSSTTSGSAAPTQTLIAVRITAERDGRGVAIYIGQEPGSAGKSVLHHYRTRVLDASALYGNPPSGSKRSRAQPVARTPKSDTSP